MEDADDGETERVAPPSSLHVLLLPVDRLLDHRQQLPHHVPGGKTGEDGGMGISSGGHKGLVRHSVSVTLFS